MSGHPKEASRRVAFAPGRRAAAYYPQILPAGENNCFAKNMTRAVSLATWTFLTSVALPADIQRPIAAVNEGVQVDDPAAKIPIPVPKKELLYEIQIKNGSMMMSLHNPSDMELAIQFGKAKALLRAGARTKIEFPDQQIAELKVFTRRREEWRLLFSAKVPRQPAKAAIPLKP